MTMNPSREVVEFMAMKLPTLTMMIVSAMHRGMTSKSWSNDLMRRCSSSRMRINLMMRTRSILRRWFAIISTL